jgi:iron complex outermembrane receptor protein
VVLQTGFTGINIFSNGPDTITRGVDVVFDFPVSYAYGKIDYTVSATYNATQLTKLPNVLASVPGQPLYDAEAVSDLTSATPRFVANFGALWTFDKLTVNLMEKIYGKASEFQNSTDNPGKALIYYNTQTGVTPITNLDIGYQVMEHFQVNVGATNTFNRFPNKINGDQRLGEANFTYGSNASSSQYPLWSPFGVNGGFYYVKAAFKF